MAQGKANATSSANDEVDLDDLMDVSEPSLFISLLSSSLRSSFFCHTPATLYL